MTGKIANEKKYWRRNS